jgi:hypothetical protein
VSRQIYAKPDTCTERCDVNPTGISKKVARITLGGPPVCLVLPTSRDAGMGWRESAEAIRAALTKSRRAEPAKSGKGAMSPLSLDSCPERELAIRAVGAGSPEGDRSVYRPMGEWSAERKLDPATGGGNRRIRDPYVRWCGRTAGVTPPPTRLAWTKAMQGIKQAHAVL